MKIDDIATTNKLLLIIICPLLFYILDLLSFIFVPLMFAVFIALLFTPVMRWLKKRNMPKFLALSLVLLVIFSTIFTAFKLVQVSMYQIDAGKREIFEKLDTKLAIAIKPYAEYLNFEKREDESAIKSILQSKQLSEVVFGNFQITLGFFQRTVVQILMILFFLVLLLAGSLNFKLVLQETIFKGKTKSVKTFMTIEQSIVQFLKVKFLMSLFTGIGFGLVCYFFGISFPLFWGLLAFVLNFVQMVGSIIVTVIVSLFAYIEIDFPGTLLAVILCFTGVQIVFGSVLEPILMGKSFSINIIVVLVMLMFWGYLWGVPGLILAIPMTVLMKTIMGEFASTRSITRLMS